MDLVTPTPWMILPFGVLLAAMAVGPLVFERWWSKHYPKVAYGLGAITLVYYLLSLRAYTRVAEVGHEYASFIALIGSLFVVAGGIHLNVRGESNPLTNTVFLFVGALLANLLGTTGASMLLIRPWIRMNRYRVTAHHIVFFIFIVSNVGGCLTPVGDPPLFLGYLQGVPFWWVARHCWPMWLVGVLFLLAIFYALDCLNFRRAPREVRANLVPPRDEWRLQGLGNIVWLGVILGAVFITRPLLLREAVMVGAAVASYFSTRREIHEANHFSFHPIQEVTILFSGIFATMLPALDWLQIHAGQLGKPSPAFFYWASGGLSSLLDNAPTYLSFLSTLQGLFHNSGAAAAFPGQSSALGLATHSPFDRYLLGLSIGAVFFGACTYIGNGPNFMVKAIANHQKVHTPGFFGYILKYTIPYLAPLLVLLWLLFFAFAPA